MARLLVGLLGLLVAGGAAYLAMGMTRGPAGGERPGQTLDNARKAAERIEAEQQQRLDEAERKLREAEDRAP